MGGWNYRIILHDVDEKIENHYYGLHEVYYDLNGSTGWTENPTSSVCGTDEDPKEGIIRALEMALNTLRKTPVIVESKKETWIKAP